LVESFAKEEKMKKCLYCKTEIPEESVIDFCESCGIKVFGDVLFKDIIKNMEQAKDKGDLYQGFVSEDLKKEKLSS